MRRFLRSLITALLIAAAVQCFTIWGLASNLPGQVGAPDIREIRELRFPRVKRVRLTNEDGSVQVRVHELDEVRVEASINAYVKSRRDLPAAQSFVASLVRADNDGTLLDVVTEPAERPDPVDLEVDYTFLVPAGTDVAIEGSNGNVWISKGCGQVDVKGRNTDIEIVEPDGPVFAQSTNGRIRVLDAPENATIRTINGNVYVHMLGGTLTASTTNGAIVAHVLDPRVEACDLSSHNGGITLVMQEGCSAAVEAVTKRGSITSDFEVACEDGIRKRRHLRGTIGEGHTRLHIDTLNGEYLDSERTDGMKDSTLPWRVSDVPGVPREEAWGSVAPAAERVPDLEWVRLAQKGDTEAFSELVRRHQQLVFNLAYRFMRETALAEDMAQETFIKAYRLLKGFRGDCHFTTWLYRVTSSVCLTELGKRKKRHEVALEAMHDRQESAPMPDSFDMPDLVRRCVDQLPDRYTQAVTLYYLKETPYEEIARILEIPMGTLKTWLHRARHQLKRIVEKEMGRHGAG